MQPVQTIQGQVPPLTARTEHPPILQFTEAATGQGHPAAIQPARPTTSLQVARIPEAAAVQPTTTPTLPITTPT